MKSEKIANLVAEQISGEWGDEGNNIAILRTTNFTNDGRLDFTEVVRRNVSQEKILRKKLKLGDTIIEKSGGSPTQPVGRVVYFDATDQEYLCNNFTSILRPSNEIDSRYFFWMLFANHVFKRTLNFQNKTTGIINLKLERYLQETKIPLPRLPIQKRVAAILDKADSLRQKDKQLLELYNQLSKSIFYEMFGDPILNDKKWHTAELQSCVRMIGGGTPDTSRDDYYKGNIPWVSPKDMKSDVIEDSIDHISELAVNESSTNLIQPFNVLMVVRSGILKKTLPVAINSVPVAINQDMKALICDEIIDPYFLLYQLRFQSWKLLSKTRVVTADNLNTNDIKTLKLILPPKGYQQNFSKALVSIYRQLKVNHQSRQKLESLFQGLLQNAFNGELVKEA